MIIAYLGYLLCLDCYFNLMFPSTYCNLFKILTNCILFYESKLFNCMSDILTNCCRKPCYLLKVQGEKANLAFIQFIFQKVFYIHRNQTSFELKHIIFSSDNIYVKLQYIVCKFPWEIIWNHSSFEILSPFKTSRECILK